jgi:hypothetical protein
MDLTLATNELFAMLKEVGIFIQKDKNTAYLLLREVFVGFQSIRVIAIMYHWSCLAGIDRLELGNGCTNRNIACIMRTV